ncbi:hypothetical protein RJ639_013674 [Escallonia herrerae]|uniref:Peptidase M48 domain-containing protein n=1 Tax=Escallonia herrerae TaxID=1293975 RepID=A0AA88VIZ3_9ASTE|nr:hypothetical protein RJ639_013674 [Escallonia herrerae]
MASKSQPREVYGLYKDESPTLCPRCLSERESLNEPHGQTANNLKWATYEKLSSAREILGGHGAARHLSEKLMTSVWISALVGDFIKPLVEEFVECYLSPRRELEADYIGLMIMASARYDPRVALTFYKLLLEKSYSSTHPSGCRRSEMLNGPEDFKDLKGMSLTFENMLCPTILG